MVNYLWITWFNGVLKRLFSFEIRPLRPFNKTSPLRPNLCLSILIYLSLLMPLVRKDIKLSMGNDRSMAMGNDRIRYVS